MFRRGGGIRTHDLFVPNEARYQAAPHPDVRLSLAGWAGLRHQPGQPRGARNNGRHGSQATPAKRRREAAEAFDGGGRMELAGREPAEGLVLEGYLPASLADDVRYACSRRVSDATQRHRPAYAAVLRGPCVRVVRVGKGSRERPT